MLLISAAGARQQDEDSKHHYDYAKCLDPYLIQRGDSATEEQSAQQ